MFGNDFHSWRKPAAHDYCPNWHRIDCKRIQSFWSWSSDHVRVSRYGKSLSGVRGWGFLKPARKINTMYFSIQRCIENKIIVDSRHSIDSNFSLSSPHSFISATWFCYWSGTELQNMKKINFCQRAATISQNINIWFVSGLKTDLSWGLRGRIHYVFCSSSLSLKSCTINIYYLTRQYGGHYHKNKMFIS